MAVTGKLVGIGAPTVGTLPVNGTRLATHLAWTSLRPSKLDRDFLLQKLLEDLGHPVDDDLLHLDFHCLENRSTLLPPFSFAWENGILILLKTPCDKYV